MSQIKLLPGADPKAAAEQLRAVFSEAEAQWMAGSAPVVAGVLSGKLRAQDAGEQLADAAEDLEDQILDRLPQVMDSFWDFSAYPGGPVGQLLEGLDGEFWGAVFSLAGPVVGSVARWFHDLLILDELERERRAARLTDRAAEMRAEASRVDDLGRERRARALRRRAARKEERAAGLVA